MKSNFFGNRARVAVKEEMYAKKAVASETIADSRTVFSELLGKE